MTEPLADSAALAWYALRTKPRKEQQVYAYLQAQQVETFYPSIRVKPVNPRSSTLRPYFPGYLFVHVCLDEKKEQLQWTPGSVGLVNFGGEAASVPDYLIYELRKHLHAAKVFERTRQTHFKAGEVLRIVEGPFAGYEALFDMYLDDDERAQVLLRWLGRQVRTQVQASALTRTK